jgi:hypothetical protein
VGRLAHGLPPPDGRRSVAADVPACLAQRLQRSRPHDREQRRLCGRRATERSEWRGGRAADRWLCSGKAAAGTSLHLVFSGPAPGMAGDRGGVRDARAPSGAERSDLRAGPIAKRASVLRSRTDEEARDPRARERAAACFSLRCRPDRVASGMEARQGRDAGTPVARRAARQPGLAQRGDAQTHGDLAAAPSPPSTRSAPTAHPQIKPWQQRTRSPQRTSDTTRPWPSPP